MQEDAYEKVKFIYFYEIHLLWYTQRSMQGRKDARIMFSKNRSIPFYKMARNLVDMIASDMENLCEKFGPRRTGLKGYTRNRLYL